MTSSPSARERLGRWTRLAENTLLATLLSSLIVLAALQIVLRNVFDTGFVWADELLRIMVLWLGLIGAVVATGEGKQIAIDVLTRSLKPRLQQSVRLLMDLFAVGVCALLAWHGGRFVLVEKEFESILLGSLPAWPFQLVLPVAFALMTLRYLTAVLLRFFEMVRR